MATKKTPAAKPPTKAATNKQLAPIAKEINVRMDKAMTYTNKAIDHRLAAALKLAEAKKLCEAGDVDFKAWATKHFKQSFDELRRLTNCGTADDPRQAIEDLRTRKANDNRKLRARKKNGSRSPEPAIPQHPAEHADDGLNALPDDERLSVVTHHAEKMGMAVVSKTEAEKPAAEKAPPKPKATLSNAKNMFTLLAASDKMKMLKWAAESVGATIDHGFSGAAKKGNGEDKGVVAGLPAGLLK